jgi:catecholate siderophore receptor
MARAISSATSRSNQYGIRATGGLSGTLLGALRPFGQAVGLASALASAGSVAHAGESQDATDPAAPADPSTPPSPSSSSSGSVSAEPLVLPTVRVEGKADRYRIEKSGIARVATPLVDTPQAVAVVPAQVIEEQRATTVRDALRNVSGITVSAGEGGRQGDTFILRGFSGQSDLFRDGSRDLGWFTRDTFNLEGVEVFFGPSSVVFGRGSTGGAINLVTKAPRADTFADLTLIGGSAPHGRLELDVNHELGSRVRVRGTAMVQRSGVAGRDVVEANRAGAAPSAWFRLGDHTVLAADYLYQRERGIPDYGQPFANGAPVASGFGVSRRTFYGVEGADTEQVDAHIATARLTHEFTADLRLTNALRFGRVDRLARPTAPGNLAPAANPTTVDRQRFETETDNTNLIDQLDLRGDLTTGPVKHAASLGVEVAREERKQNRYNFQVPGATGMPTNLTGDLRNPNPAPDLSGFNRIFGSSSHATQITAAAYASDQVQLGRYVEVLGSARLDSFDTAYRTTNAQGVRTELGKQDTLLNWRAGLVLHPLPKTSLYGMVGSSSNPSAEAGTLSDGTVSLDPEKNRAYEAGAKTDLLHDHLGLGASVFRIEKTNARVAGPDPQGPMQILAGKQRVDGVNVGGAGTILDGWKLIGSYTYLRSKIRAHTTPYLIGQALPSTPPHSLSLWTTYTFARIGMGGGASYQSKMAVNNPTSAAQLLNSVPSYWRLDAFASYGWHKVDLQLNVFNLTNALYYTQVAGSRAVPAEERAAMLSAKLRI